MSTVISPEAGPPSTDEQTGPLTDHPVRATVEVVSKPGLGHSPAYRVAALGAVAVIALVVAVVTWPTTTEPVALGSIPADGSVNDGAAVPYDPDGGAADPPLPAVAPAVAFDPATELASHDGSAIAALIDGRLVFTDGRSGKRKASVSVEPGTELRALSADGSKVALYLPGEDATEIMVVEAGFEVTRYEFDGVIEPEAFSTDGGLLFVIDHEVGSQPGAYRVRPLDLETGELQTILGPAKTPLLEEMNGLGRRQVWSSDGRRLYTLYIRQTHHHHDPIAEGTTTGSGAEHVHGGPGTDGFVHVLDLTEEWAFCLDLPPSFGAGDLDTTALAVSPNGTELAVLDMNAGEIAFASTDELQVTKVVPLPETLAPDGDVHLGLGPDHVAVGWGQEVQWLDRPDLSSAETAELSRPVMGLTSIHSGVLAWSSDFSTGPIELAAPTSIGGD